MVVHTANGFSWKTILMLIVEFGYEENMKKLSWFPPETPDKKEDIDDDETLQKVLHYGVGSGAITLYVVREDDPYIVLRIGDGLGHCLTKKLIGFKIMMVMMLRDLKRIDKKLHMIYYSSRTMDDAQGRYATT